jgi:Mrp family chromosome partitioning ATPase
MRRVLLMEGDFQNPMVHRLLRVEMPMSGGFSAQLQRHLHARDSVRVWDVVQGSESIDILAEGLIRSPGAILSQQFEQSLEDLKHYYDIIVIDGPPLGSSSECRAFADMVDGVVVCTSRERPDVQSADSVFENKRFVIAHQVGEA